MLLAFIVTLFVMLLTGSAYGAEELTEVQTVSPLADQILVWLSVTMTVITVLANTLPAHWPLTQLLARLSTDLRGIRKPDPVKTTKLPSVNLLVLLALLFPGCAGHPLEQVADRVPVALQCPQTDGDAVRAAIDAYLDDPKALRDSLVKQAKRDPVSVACLLLDARALLIAEGRRAEAIYREVQDGLVALGVE